MGMMGSSAGPLGRRRAAAESPDRFEDVVGGRLLAWVGGVSLLLGVVFFLAIAVSRGWLGEAARCAMAAGGALALLGVAVRLRERGGHEEAVLTAAGAALGVLFLDVAVATRAYELVPALAGAGLAAAIGALGVVLAIRWDAKAIGVLGILGGLAAPLLAGAPSDDGTILLLLITAAAAGAVLVHQRWPWLGLAAFAVTAPQLLLWLADVPAPGAVVTGLSTMGLITAAQAVGLELRTKASDVRSSAVWLLAADALLLAAGGRWALHAGGHDAIADAWLAGLAVAHGLVALIGARHPRVSDDLRLVALGIGTALADVAWNAVADGVAVSAGFAISAIGFAFAARAVKGRRLDGIAAQGALGVHLLLAAGHALVIDAPPTSGGGAATLALVPLAAACFTSARVAALPRAVRDGLDGFALGVLGYLAALALDPVSLTLAWAAESVALGRIWRRTDSEVAGAGALMHLAAAAIVALVLVATPVETLALGYDAPLGALAALAALTLACGAGAWLARPLPTLARGLATSSAMAGLLLASGAVVTLADGGQTGQMWLSALWAAAGAGALIAGLAVGLRDVRHGALTLLGITVAKVFVLDLAGLDSAYRAGSFIALGVLLLGAAFAWQRLRPMVAQREAVMER